MEEKVQGSGMYMDPTSFKHVRIGILKNFKASEMVKIQYDGTSGRVTTEWVPTHLVVPIIGGQSAPDQPIQIVSTSSLGRLVVSNKRISAGEKIVASSLFAKIVSEKHRAKTCHNCLKPLRRKAFQCDTCRFSRYCSKDCMANDILEHDLQCLSLKSLAANKLNNSSNTAGNKIGTVETLRLAMAVLARKEVSPSKNACPFDTLIAHCNENLINSETKQLIKVVICNLKQMIRNKSLAIQKIYSDFDLLNIVLRIQFNAHDIVSHTGLGIFPLASLVNHSCRPNSVYSFDKVTQKLVLRSTEEIPANCEITYSYLGEMYSPRKTRQESLKLAFNFDCKCRQCSLPMTVSSDRFLESFWCSKCKEPLSLVAQTYECIVCKTFVPKSELDSFVTEVLRTIRAVNECGHDNQRELSLYHKLMDLRSTTSLLRFLHPLHYLHDLIAQIILNAAFRQNDFRKSYECCVQMISMWHGWINNKVELELKPQDVQVIHPRIATLVDLVAELALKIDPKDEVLAHQMKMKSCELKEIMGM